jgi:hypothetical protein
VASRFERVKVIDKVKDAESAKVITVISLDAKGAKFSDEEETEVSANGLVQRGSGGKQLDVPLVILKTPIAVGTSWEVKTVGFEGVATIGAIETIEVPAGKFEAVRVDLEQTVGGRNRKVQAWYALGIGLVKMTQNGEELWLLKSFTPAKE